jgi:hypothetical protein
LHLYKRTWNVYNKLFYFSWYTIHFIVNVMLIYCFVYIFCNTIFGINIINSLPKHVHICYITLIFIRTNTYQGAKLKMVFLEKMFLVLVILISPIVMVFTLDPITYIITLLYKLFYVPLYNVFIYISYSILNIYKKIRLYVSRK